MKRLIMIGVSGLVCFGALCFGQPRSRSAAHKVVQLPEPKLRGQMSLEEALAKQRGAGQFTGQPLSFAQVGQLAWAGLAAAGPQAGPRNQPLAQEPYPADLYIALPEGLFAYKPTAHSLEQVLNQDMRGMLATAAGMQEAAARAGCDIIIAGSLRRISAKLGDDARKYMFTEAGRIAQNIQLQAASLDLGSFAVGGFDARDVKRICKLPQALDPVYMICVGYPSAQTVIESAKGQDSPGAIRPAIGKRAVLIIASENFRDDELYEAKRIIEASGAETIVASSRAGIAKGMLGNPAEVKVTINQLRVDDYDAVVFLGGSGTVEYFDNPLALNIAREAAGKRKILAAISAAPTVLANAKVLTGIRVTGFLSERERLQQAGAVYTGNPVERDKFIITGIGGNPMASAEFARAVADALSGR